MKGKGKDMDINDKFWNLIKISFTIFICCGMYDVWVGFSDPQMSIKLFITTLFVILIGQPILVFIHNIKHKGK